MSRNVRFYETKFHIHDNATWRVAYGESGIGVTCVIDRIHGGFESSVCFFPLDPNVKTLKQFTLRRDPEGNVTIKPTMEPIVFSSIEEAAETTALFLHENIWPKLFSQIE